MKHQVIAIHGGNTFKTRDDYLAHLKDYPLTISGLTTRKWREKLDELLGPDFEVLSPKMPNKDNAQYAEWKIWFEKLIPFIRDGVVLIGHSLGGIFLCKYLAENTFPRKIRAVLIVAAPYDTTDYVHYLGDFMLPPKLDAIAHQSDKIVLYFSKDDKSVPFTDLARYQQALPMAIVRIFEDRGHFSQAEFPEIVEDIKSLIS